MKLVSFQLVKKNVELNKQLSIGPGRVWPERFATILHIAIFLSISPCYELTQ